MANQYSCQINCHFLWVPRIVNFLSRKDEMGKLHRITSSHIHFLLYLHGLPEFYKSISTMAFELGWSKRFVIKIKKELSEKWEEIDCPLISVSCFKTLQNQLRHQIELFYPLVQPSLSISGSCFFVKKKSVVGINFVDPRKEFNLMA